MSNALGSKVLQSNGRHRSVFIYTDPVTTNAGTQTLVHTKSQTEQSEVRKQTSPLLRSM